MYNKYRNKITFVDGIRFDSKKEANVYQQLKILEKEHCITELTRQNKYTFLINDEPVRYITDKLNKDGTPKKGRPLTYVDDFKFFDFKTNSYIVVDVKGIQTDAFKIKRALMKSINNISIEIW